MRIAAIWLTCAALPTAIAAAQQADSVPLARRAWVASKMYESVQRYFGHWQGVPNLDVDSAYRAYLDEALGDPDRRQFDLASLAFIATLRNGHSNFNDSWLWQHYGQTLGFTVAHLRGDWVVRESRMKGLEAGDVLRAIDGTPIADFVASQVRYASGSSERARLARVFSMPFLFPATFTLTLDGGRSVRITRGAPTGPQPEPEPTIDSLTLAGGVPYLAIRSFGQPSFEQAAIEFLRAHADAPAIVIDVRGNGGGTTPQALIRALMDRPYSEWTEATPMSVALFGAYRRIQEIVSPSDLTDYTRGYIDGLSEFDRTMMTTIGRTIPPQHPVYTGRLAVLIDDRCASACEDFVMPLEAAQRAILVGSTTYGSTGQPYMYAFDNGMSFRVSTKREYFPDGSTFEGVGITPNVAIEPSAADLRAGRDPVLERALAALRAEPGGG